MKSFLLTLIAKMRALRGLLARIPFKLVGHRILVTSLAAMVAAGSVWFVLEATTAWKIETSAKLSCQVVVNPAYPAASIQYNVKDQSIEPFFRGTIMMGLGDIRDGPSRVSVSTSGGRGYGTQVDNPEFFRDEPNHQWWMRKESAEFPFVRTAGSHRDFPFDSATIDIETKIDPPQNFGFLFLRNFNSSFYIPCETFTVRSDSPGKIHMTFELHRNPLVRMMAIVILIVALMFVVLIPFTIKRDALPTSVASFFFSIWSIRGILSSEMKVFPTILDMTILSLCVLLLLLIGVRLLRDLIRRSASPELAR